MKFYIKSYKEILKNVVKVGSDLYPKGYTNGPSFVFKMKLLCGKGPFEFRWIKTTNFGKGNNWFRGKRFTWHISWLEPIGKHQYLLEF